MIDTINTHNKITELINDQLKITFQKELEEQCYKEIKKKY